MTHTLVFYQDQLLQGAKSAPLRPTHRMILVRHGRVRVGERVLAEGEALYAADASVIAGEGEWSMLWRWELEQTGTPPNLLSGEEIHSIERMSREITSLDMKPGSRWLFRLDRIRMPAGRVTDPHVHPGPGIRCLLEGTFSAEQKSEAVPQRLPGDPWWEVGPDEVVARGAPTMRTRFMRGMILPEKFSGGTETATWLDSKKPPASGHWTLFVDHSITV
jgi:hypothetical protein